MLPNLIVIGGAKCGTTSFHHYLSLHPEICMSQPKELNFFIEEDGWRRGIPWYETKFPGRSEAIRGEASPHYTRYPVYRGVPARMHSVIPDAKLVYILRDPMERLISQIVDDFSSFSDTYKDLRAALLPFDASPFVTPSLQCSQLQQYLQYYPLSQILLITAEELAKERSKTMAKVFRFLRVDETFTSKDFSLVLNPRSVKRQPTRGFRLIKEFLAFGPGRMLPYRLGLPVRHWLMRASAPQLGTPQIDRELEETLLEIFHEDVQRLRQLTGMKLESWRV
jgi:sulfotransferase family protein